MSFERRLVLNRWLHGRFGAASTSELLERFERVRPAPGGESPFLRVVLESDEVTVDEQRLRRYDDRILSIEADFAARRDGFSWKPFQYLALLYTELLLDELTSDPRALTHALNGWLGQAAGDDPLLEGFPAFGPGDLRRLAFFMATGSGKTLLMHANYRQALYYLRTGAHGEALVDRPDGRAEFANVLLVTPTETLSRQHIDELRLSGIAATHLVYDADPGAGLFDPPVRVVEITKLRPAEEISGDGLSIALESLGAHNLLLVDEGHKGKGRGEGGVDAGTWKTRQYALSAGGLLLEYSATFAQAVASAPRNRRADLETEYGRSIVFDYSYRHFYEDGYGKHFDVLNLRADESERAHELLVGGLLTFWQQLHLFETGGDALRPFNIERPLWVFIGHRVVKSAAGDLADVAVVVDFLRRFLEDRNWAVAAIERFLTGDSGFRDAQADRDLFVERLDELHGTDPAALYDRIRDGVFHGGGALEVWELKNADGELGLRVSGADGAPWFGVINVGDARALAKHLEEQLGLTVLAEEFVSSLFGDLDRRDSPVHILIGSRRFIEGWSSWRVSSMGLLNMGRGEGPQVIQLFGRGVRLKGRGMSLRRSTLPGADLEELPAGLKHLETLYISGWNADYIQAFRKMLAEEDLGWEETVEMLPLFEPLPPLYVPRPRADYDVSRETWTLVPTQMNVVVDRVPKVTAMLDGVAVRTEAGDVSSVNFAAATESGLLDVDRLYADLLAYKHARRARGYGNVFIRREEIMPVLAICQLKVTAGSDLGPEVLHRYALDALQTYLDRFVARSEKEAESRELEPVLLEVRESTASYTVRGTSGELREQVLDLIRHPDRLKQASDEVLPRLHVDRHLYAPLLLDPGADEPRIAPPGLKGEEIRFVRNLADYWREHSDDAEFTSQRLYLLRNQPHRGVGFFRRSGFFPDFMLWLYDDLVDRTRLRFVEPHGMHHGGLSDNQSRTEALKELEALSGTAPFAAIDLDMAGWIVTKTERRRIPGAEHMTAAQLRDEHRILELSNDYIETILKS